jgi:AcrR family transcriptional regulator
MRKQPEITEQTRQNLIDAFWELYLHKRIENITIKEITMKAGYNRGTFYEYFTDIYDMLGQIEDSLIPDLTMIPPLTMGDSNFGMSLDLFLKICQEQGRYYAVLLGNNGDPSFVRRLKDTLKSMLSKTFGSDCHEDIELDLVWEYTLSAMIGVMSYWLSNQNSITVENLLSLIGDLMNDGVSKKLYCLEPTRS